MSDHERKLLREAELVACKPRHVQRAFEALIPELRLPLMCVHQRGKLSIKHGRKIVVPIIQGGGNVLLFPNKLEISCGNMNECGARSERANKVAVDCYSPTSTSRPILRREANQAPALVLALRIALLQDG